MRRLGIIAPLLAALLTPSAAIAQAPAASGVTVYRCTDSKGQLVALRDSPCRSGERQEVVRMQRPQDPPPRPASPAPASPAPATNPLPHEIRIVTVQPPQPVYECTTPDGDRYTSENGEGNPRWVPAWTTGYPRWSSRGPRSGPPLGQPDRPNHPPSHGMLVPISGTWVRDECHALPQTEVCARLSDQRYALIRRYNSALQGERRQLELEQRGIEARLSNDCGIN